MVPSSWCGTEYWPDSKVTSGVFAGTCRVVPNATVCGVIATGCRRARSSASISTGGRLVPAVMAFNLTRAAATITGPGLAAATTATIRRKLIAVPARVATSARRYRPVLERRRQRPVQPGLRTTVKPQRPAGKSLLWPAPAGLGSPQSNGAAAGRIGRERLDAASRPRHQAGGLVMSRQARAAPGSARVRSGCELAPSGALQTCRAPASWKFRSRSTSVHGRTVAEPREATHRALVPLVKGHAEMMVEPRDPRESPCADASDLDHDLPYRLAGVDVLERLAGVLECEGSPHHRVHVTPFNQTEEH